MRTATVIVALAAVGPLTEATTTQRARYLMGTVCEVAADNPEQIELAFAEARRIEEMLSTWIDTSELSRVNRGEMEPGAELRVLLDTTMEWSRRTDRAFDPRIGHLVHRFRVAPAASGADPARGPAAEAAAATQNRYEEGAFGKGYALDRMLALIDSDAVMLDFGGQILARGSIDVRIANPRDRQRPVLAFTLTNASLSTSSNAERRHIVDPRTGRPLPSRGSVSVVAEEALAADILSTALYVMGEDEGLRWANRNQVAAIFINDANQIRLSTRAPRVTVLDRKFKLKD